MPDFAALAAKAQDKDWNAVAQILSNTVTPPPSRSNTAAAAKLALLCVKPSTTREEAWPYDKKEQQP